MRYLMAYVAKIRCDFCKREKRLDQIKVRYRDFKPTLFVCVSCKARGC